MKLSKYVIKEIVDHIKELKTGPQWVQLFCRYGFNDIYDELGLPDIGKPNGQRPSKKEYLYKRLLEKNDSIQLDRIIKEVITTNVDKIDICQINNLLQRDNYLIEIIDKKIIIIGDIKDNDNDEKAIKAHFDDIQNQILYVLDHAKAIIWVAMAWFTNEILAAKLVDKFNQGLDVRVVLFDDYINRQHSVELNGISVKKIKGRHGGKMHNKYCIVDNQIVITGSYNWSNNAEFKNDENIQITHDNNVSSAYSVDFLSLYNR